MSLIHLISSISSTTSGGGFSPRCHVAYGIPQLCRVPEGVVLVLSRLTPVHLLLPSVQRRLSTALPKRPEAVLSSQQQKFGTLLLSWWDWRCLSSPCLTSPLSTAESLQGAQLSLALRWVAELTSVWGFKLIYIPDVMRIT